MRTVKVSVTQQIDATRSVTVETEAFIEPANQHRAEEDQAEQAGTHAMAIIEAVIDGINQETL